MQVYCSKKHANHSSNSFCNYCGEPLPLTVGQVIDHRYEILRILGQGGFGRSYLATDRQKASQHCVIKEFAPQVSQPEQLQKAKELFEREASVLRKIQHPQIPQFHASLQSKIGTKDFFFLVQDYIDGDNYYQLLEERLSQGKTFTEAEIIDLLKKLLPVLAYIQSINIVHRDISPDNLILRRSDNLPVLIDFGGVKQLPASQGFWSTKLAVNMTLLGKKGYAPEEQIRHGKTYKNSDLYSLAVTVLVLLTGKEPQFLYDSYQGLWYWGKEIKVSPSLEAVLKKMLAYKPSDRYQKADQVLNDLPSSAIVPSAKIQTSYITNIKTMVVAPGRKQLTALVSKFQMQTQAVVQQVPQWLRPLTLSFLGTGFILSLSAGCWALGNFVVRGVSSIHVPSISLPKLPGGKKANDPQKIFTHREHLQISTVFFTRLVDEEFYRQNPELKGRSLRENPEDATLRDKWYEIADNSLNQIEQAHLSLTSRQKLGKYSLADYQGWKKQAQSSKLAKYKNIEQLKADTYEKFDQLFPGQQHGKLNQQTFLQIWYAIAADKLS